MRNITKHEWWATPVWEIDTGFDGEFNQKLLEELQKLPTQNYDVWNYNSPYIILLKNKIFEILDNTISNYFPDYYPYDPCLINGWINRHGIDKHMPLHDHGGALMACVYYVKSQKNSGDLLLLDPRGGANWEWLQEDDCYGIKYKRIEPEEGKLVLFPAFLIHMVEQNKSGTERISIATNIHNGKLNPKHR